MLRAAMTLAYKFEEIAARELKPSLYELDGISRATIEAHYKLYEGYVNKRNEILGRLDGVRLGRGPALQLRRRHAEHVPDLERDAARRPRRLRARLLPRLPDRPRLVHRRLLRQPRLVDDQRLGVEVPDPQVGRPRGAHRASRRDRLPRRLDPDRVLDRARLARRRHPHGREREHRRLERVAGLWAAPRRSRPPPPP